MASRIEQALGNNPQSPQTRLRGSTLSGNGYRAAQVGAPNIKQSSLVGAFEKFGNAAVAAYSAYDNRQEADGKKQAEWLTKYAKENPEGYREAFNNGTLRYQDNKYAMQFLRHNLGSNSSFRADAEIQRKIDAGDYGPDDEQVMLKDKLDLRKSFAESDAKLYGVKPEDEDFQFGLASSIHEREISMNDKWDSFKSNFNENTAIVSAKQTLSGAMHGLDATNGEQHATQVTGYLESTRANAQLNDKQRESILRDHVRNLSGNPSGGAALTALGDQEVMLYGKKVKVADYFGREQWNSALGAANSSFMEQDRARSSQFEAKISDWNTSTDIPSAIEDLRSTRAQYNRMQPGEAQTQALARLDSVEAALNQKLQHQTAENAKLEVKKTQSNNRGLSINRNIDLALNGNMGIPLTADTMPTDDNTGEYKEEDFVNAISGRINTIMGNPNLSEQEKASKVMELGQLTGKNGYIQKVLQPTIDGANNSIEGSIVTGEPVDDLQLSQLQRYYRADPQSFSKMFPKEAETVASLDRMERLGLTPKQYVDSERELRKQRQSPDQGREAQLNWTTNSASTSNVNFLPEDLKEMAHRVYLSEFRATGDTRKALQAADRWAADHVTTFGEAGVQGKIQGGIPSSSLQVGQSVKTQADGKRLMDAHISRIATENRLETNQMTVRYDSEHDLIAVYGNNGEGYQTFTTGELSAEYEREQQAARQEYNEREAAKQAEILANANKRAPITQATRAREEAGKRVREKRKEVPNFIYGGGKETK